MEVIRKIREIGYFFCGFGSSGGCLGPSFGGSFRDGGFIL